MLSKNQVVAVRKAIEAQYIGTCTVTEMQDFTKPNKSTGQREAVVLQNQPCKLSFGTLNATEQTSAAANVAQVVKLLIAPELIIKPGSKLTVIQNDVSTDYVNSGQPATFNTHQEIMLDLFKGWA